MSTFDLLAELPLRVEGYQLEGLEADVSSNFKRLSTVVHLYGDGADGVGEDVVYEPEDHVALQQAGPVLDLNGHYMLTEFCELIDGLDLFPVEPSATSRACIAAGPSTARHSTSPYVRPGFLSMRRCDFHLTR